LKRKEIVAKEQNGTASALERCRPLAEQIRAEVREKEPEGLDTLALAEFLVALQGAAAVVLDGSTVTGALPQSSSASRRTAVACGFLILATQRLLPHLWNIAIVNTKVPCRKFKVPSSY
jgi:hypothetical protein